MAGIREGPFQILEPCMRFCIKISFKPTGLYGPQSHQGSKSSDYLTPQNRGQETAGDSFSWNPRGKAFIWQGQHEGQPGPYLSAVLHRVFPPLCCSPFFHVENSNTAQFSFGKIIVFLKCHELNLVNILLGNKDAQWSLISLYRNAPTTIVLQMDKGHGCPALCFRNRTFLCALEHLQSRSQEYYAHFSEEKTEGGKLSDLYNSPS